MAGTSHMTITHHFIRDQDLQIYWLGKVVAINFPFFKLLLAFVWYSAISGKVAQPVRLAIQCKSALQPNSFPRHGN
jgi:hypothetical protein